MMHLLKIIETKNKITSRTKALTLAVLCAALGAPASFSAQGTDGSSFRLTVIKEDMPSLSRNELNRSAKHGSVSAEDGTPATTLPLSGGIDDLSKIDDLLPPQKNPQESLPQLPPSSNNNSANSTNPTTQPDQTEGPNGSMLEIGIDWRTWIRKLTDKWYFVLKNMEAQSGYSFHTARHAQIHFTCYPNGQIGNVYLVQSSGVPMYDQLQAQALLQCVPLHPFPKGTKRTSFTLVLGWESHPPQTGEHDFRPGSYDGNAPMEIVRQWVNPR